MAPILKIGHITGSCNIIFVLLQYICFKISGLSSDKDHGDALHFLDDTEKYTVF